MSHRVFCIVGLAAMFAAGAFCQTANAQNVAPSSGLCYIWIDAKTGERVDTYPQGTEAGSGNPNQRSRPTHVMQDGSVIPGKDFVRGPDGSWTDAATGQPVDTYPQGTEAGSGNPNQRSRPTHVMQDGSVIPGKDFVRVPCPPTGASTTPPIQSSTLPGGDTKTTDTKTPDTRTTNAKKPRKEVKHKATKHRRAKIDNDQPASSSGVSPETARTIGTIIDIGVGIGLSRVGRHHDRDDMRHDRGDAPRGDRLR